MVGWLADEDDRSVTRIHFLQGDGWLVGGWLVDWLMKMIAVSPAYIFCGGGGRLVGWLVGWLVG